MRRSTISVLFIAIAIPIGVLPICYERDVRVSAQDERDMRESAQDERDMRESAQDARDVRVRKMRGI